MCLGHEVEDLETSNKSAAEQLVLQSSGPQASDPTPPHVIIRLGSAVKLAASLSTHLFEVYKKAVQENAERTKDFEDLKDQYQMKLSQKQCIIISQKMPIARSRYEIRDLRKEIQELKSSSGKKVEGP